ncbi:MAG TPA: hypothetical protein VJW23_02295 [Propionibacteriaceae bacterium]|jgi:hypothetical protein|nr:hypothetical protein [Propionibacteriaceae bacterium]
MSWRWVPDHKPSPSRSHADSPSINRTFPTQGEAETWLGEFYPSLLRAGVRAVSLYEADRLVYGPMSLEPEI